MKLMLKDKEQNDERQEEILPSSGGQFLAVSLPRFPLLIYLKEETAEKMESNHRNAKVCLVLN